jgi:hypothetical protein
VSNFQKSLCIVYVGILLISASYFLQDFYETGNYLEAWLMQWVSLKQWVLAVPSAVVGILFVQD